MLVTSKEILTEAREKRYAVGAFNAFDYITADAIITAAEETQTPIIVQVGDLMDPKAPENRLMTRFEAMNFMHCIRSRAEASPIPVAIHLDHCRTFEGCARSIQMGVTSVMIDGSMLPFEENISITKKVVEMARPCGVSVEAEIGHVAGAAGDEVGEIYTTVEEARAFYEGTNVDLLAIAIGTAHGVYASKPSLQYDRIRELKEAIPIPLVMHGASGLEAAQYQRCVQCGISKINFATYMFLAGADAMKEVFVANVDGKLKYPDVLKIGARAETEIVKQHIGFFGTQSVA